MANTKLKPLYLLDIFREMTDERHRMTVPELLEELQRRGITAERKGIYRDSLTREPHRLKNVFQFLRKRNVRL